MLSMALAVSAVSFTRAQEDGARKEVDYAVVYNTANQAFAAGKFDEAARGMEEVITAINADPSKSTPAQIATVHYLLGAAYFNIPDYPKAIAAFRTYVEKFPTGEKVLEVKLALARALFFDKQYDEALKAFAPLELVPTLRSEALTAEAQCYAAMNKPKDQIIVLERLVPANVQTHEQATGALDLIDLYANNNQAQKALALIHTLSARIGLVDNIVAFNATITSFADALAAQGKYEMAIDVYREVKDRDAVIRFQKDRIAEMDARMQANLRAGAGSAQAMASAVQTNATLRERRNQAQNLLTAFEKLPPFGPALLLRQAKAWYDWGRRWEAMVALDRLLKKYPGVSEREPALYMMIAAAADANQPARALEFCTQYSKEFPQGANAETVGYLAGSVALQAADDTAAESYFGKVLDEHPHSQYREAIRYEIGNAKMNRGDYAAAVVDYQRYLSEFPDGEHAAEVEYRIALSALFAGKYDEAVAGLNKWLTRHPNSQLTPDCKYRLMVCDYAAQKYDDVLKSSAEWMKQYAGNEMTGEVLSLVGDAQAAKGDNNGAIESYRKSAKIAATDEVLNYSLLEAAKLLQKNGNWDGVSEMFEEFV
ncbi:MAG: outer membrane protein assembly factor BamD, partial [Chthoniobacterales bacterium]